MDTMVEKVARALALADLDPETRRIVDLDAHMLHVREHYSGLARAAIEAVWPDQSIIDDAKRQLRQFGGISDNVGRRLIAALTDAE